jgi:hypothetical protein
MLKLQLRNKLSQDLGQFNAPQAYDAIPDYVPLRVRSNS